ncbi:MAG: hypothetical protein ABUL67_03350 [Haliangium ochraceum]
MNQEARGGATTIVAVPAALITATLLGWAGCAGCFHLAAQPADAVRDFAGRVAAGRWDQAYALMSSDYRRRVSFQAFRRDMDADRQAVNAGALALARSDLGDSSTASVRLPDEDRVALAFEDGAWRLVEQPLAPFGQHSPRAALRTFVRAVDSRRYDVLLRLVPMRQRAGVTEASLRLAWEGAGSAGRHRLLAIVRENMRAAPIVDLGSEAYMPCAAVGHENDESAETEVRLIVEDGVWKIEDVR